MARSHGTKKFTKKPKKKSPGDDIDADNPPICEEDGEEMELGVNGITHNYSWTCPECGWGYDVEGTA